jgi:hypothetical protein
MFHASMGFRRPVMLRRRFGHISTIAFVTIRAPDPSNLHWGRADCKSVVPRVGEAYDARAAGLH